MSFNQRNDNLHYNMLLDLLMLNSIQNVQIFKQFNPLHKPSETKSTESNRGWNYYRGCTVLPQNHIQP